MGLVGPRLAVAELVFICFAIVRINTTSIRIIFLVLVLVQIIL